MPQQDLSSDRLSGLDALTATDRPLLRDRLFASLATLHALPQVDAARTMSPTWMAPDSMTRAVMPPWPRIAL